MDIEKQSGWDKLKKIEEYQKALKQQVLQHKEMQKLQNYMSPFEAKYNQKLL